MSFKSRWFYIFFGSFVIFCTSLNFSCGKKEGPANAGVTNTYYFAYFGNYGSSNVTAYWLEPSGSLNDLNPGSYTASGTTSVNDLATNASATFLYTVNKNSDNVAAFTISPISGDQSGTLTYSSVTAANASGTASIKIHPNALMAYSTNSNSISNNVTAFSIDPADGSLSRIANYTARTVPYDLEITPNGDFLYVVNRSTNDISSFGITSATGVLSTISLSTSTGTNPEDVIVDSSGRYLYVLCNGSNNIYMYSIDSVGVLSALSTPTVSVGNGAKKMAFSADYRYLYVTNNIDNTISVFSMDSSSGVLTSVSGSPFVGPSGAGVYSISASPDGKYLLVGGDSDGKGYVYLIESASGGISQVGSGVSVGSNPRSIAIVPLEVVE